MTAKEFLNHFVINILWKLVKEKEKLKRFLQDVIRLSRQGNLSKNNTFVLREKTRVILKILGGQYITKILVVKAIDVIQDPFPFKLYRLRKLANG